MSIKEEVLNYSNRQVITYGFTPMDDILTAQETETKAAAQKTETKAVAQATEVEKVQKTEREIMQMIKTVEQKETI